MKFNKFFALFLILGFGILVLSSGVLAFNWDDDSLIHYYTFDEGTGTSIADYINGNNATTNNTPTWVTGKIGNALKFNGVNQSATTSGNISITSNQARSFMFWSNLTSTTNYNGILEYGLSVNGQKFFINTFGGTWALSKYGSDVSLTQAAQTGFHFAVITYNGTAGTLWYDGRAVGNYTTALNTGASPLEIGRSLYQTANLSGTIDELGIWNRTLTPSEIIQLYNSGLGFAYAPFNYSTTHTSSVTETTSNAFTLSMNHTGSSYLYTADFYYNGVKYTPTRTTNSNNTYLTVNVSAPLASSPTNVSWFWAMKWNTNGTYSEILNDFIGGNNSYQNTTASYQTVSPIDFGVCAGTLNPVYNFTYAYESNRSTLQGVNIEATFNFTVNTGTNIAKTVNFTASTQNYTTLCFNSSSTLTANAEITYSKASFDPRWYYLVDNSVSTSNMQTIVLYLLEIDLGTGTKVTVTDQTGTGMSNQYIYVQRYYPSIASYVNVAMLRSDQNGEDYLYLRWYDVWYRFLVYDEDGALLYTDYPRKILTNSQIVNIRPDSYYDNLLFIDGISKSLTFSNSTNTYTGLWATSDGSYVTGCLKVVRKESDGDNYICNTCVNSSSSTLTCAVGNTSGTYVGTLSLTSSNNVSSTIDLWHETKSNMHNAIGEDGAFITFILIVTVAIAGAFLFGSVTMGCVFLIIGLLLSMFIGFSPFSWRITILMVFLAAIIAYFARGK